MAAERQPWAEGAEENRGRRLLPHVVDYYAHQEPDRVFAAISTSESVPNGFEDITMKAMASAVNHMAWWLSKLLKSRPSDKQRTLAFIGPADLRYAVMLLAAIKTNWRSDVSALLYADSLRSMAKGLQKFDPSMACKQVPTMAELLQAESPEYPFEAAWADIKDQTCLILHSSGSTGPPKLVHMTHAALSCTDNDTKVPVPEGRQAQNASQFNFDPPARFYSCFPPYHFAGLMAFTLLPIFSKTATAVMGPPMMPPSGYLVDAIMKQQDVKALYLPPSIIDQWASDPESLEQAENLDFILYSGGPLAQATGDKLDDVTDICQIYGALEMGQIQGLMPQAGDWQYIEPNPAEECQFEEVDDGIYELVLNCDKKFIGQRTLAHTFPDASVWRTKDLFVPIRQSPVSGAFILEPMISSCWPAVTKSGALVVGNGRPEVLLLVEPRPGPETDRMSKKEFIDAIWPRIAEANTQSTEHGKIRRSRIVLSQPNLGFFRAPKGTISRKPTESLYAEYISAAFLDGTTDEESEIGILEKHWIDEAKRFIGSVVHDMHADITLRDSDDFFVSKAMDSLTVLELAQKIRLSLLKRMDKEKNTLNFWLRTIFENPTIEDLANATLDAVFGQGDSSRDSDPFRATDLLVEELVSELPEPVKRETISEFPTANIKVVLLGARGRLGPFIVKDLLDDPRVTGIKCLDRGTSGQEAFQRRADELKIAIDAKDPKLQFVSVDISEPDLRLPQEELNEILNHANVIIHNVWAVNFAFSLASFEHEMLKSVSSLIEMVNRAPARPRLVFISSVSSTQSWSKVISPHTLVPEEVINTPTVTAKTGYSQSKQAAERLLAAAGARLNIPISVLRVCQVAGPTNIAEGGKWESHDWMHSLAILSKASGLVPTDLGYIDWIPVDKVSSIVRDLSLHEQSTASSNFQLYNVVHPQPIPFSKFSDALQKSISSSKPVRFKEWVEHLAGLAPNKLSKDADTEKARILPWFQSIIDQEASHYSVEKAKAASPTMAGLKPIEEEWLEKWCQHWV
ncbi:hypothetical protein N7468_005341 [Penicillium chermesinum]|uniref:Uncharacterized protein n=1 Tax=Penicillium chermesinum TaxID=63820 RepID=A0A9W9NZ88_9EURO|nr:uncharacterized protein N7468_005341 [Penicillium chermesinum]KAJ5232385.1 hypothetical protein N7468_005341 [Penicillium chermesinum]